MKIGVFTIFLYLFFTLFSANVLGQLNEIDRLKVEANNARFSNTNEASSILLKGLQLAKKSNSELDIGYFYRKLISEKGNAQQLDSAIYYFHKGLKFYESTRNQKGVENMEDNLLKAHLHSELGEAFSVNLDFDQSRKIYNQALIEYGVLNDFIGVGIVKTNLANLALKQGDFPTAIQAFLSSKAIFDTTEYHYITAEICHGISSTYEKMSNLTGAIQFAEQSLAYIKKGDYEYPGIINAQINLAKLWVAFGDTLKMKYYMKRAEEGIDTLSLHYLKPMLANVQASYFMNKNDFESAKQVLLAAEPNLIENKIDAIQIFEFKRLLSDVLITTGDLKKGELILRDAIEIVDSLDMFQEGVKVAKLLADLYEENQQYEYAYFFLKKHHFYIDQTIGFKQQKAFKEIEAKYQNSVQKNQLLEQKRQIDEAAWRIQQNEFLVVILVLLLLLSLLIYGLINRSLRLRKQKELQAQHLKSSQEKLRISRDLHDNIGAELTLIKSKIDQRIYVEKDQAHVRELKELSNSSKYAMDELRKTIWATKTNQIMLAELIEKIEVFIQRFEIDYSISKNYSDLIISALTALNVYRSVQEAMQNSVKHSNATKIDVIVKKLKEGKIQLEFQDNGTGFELAQVTEGNGVQNMKDRMSEIEGEFMLHSSQNGTKIKLTFLSMQNKK